MSAICHTLAAVLLMLAGHRWTGDAVAGFTAAGLLTFSPLFWRHSLVAEVFPLNNLFAFLLLYLAARYASDREPRIAYMGGFVFALGQRAHRATR